MIQQIVLLGAGNLGSHLGRALRAAGLDVLQVFSRSIERARPLAEELETAYTTLLPEIETGADLYILAVRDDAIGTLARRLCRILPSDSLVVHTSGARPGADLRAFFARYGVFYPLQTLTAGQAVDLSDVPFCIHAPEPADEEALLETARRLSRAVYRLNDEDRAHLHVAAVFANNFPNHLFTIAQRLLNARGLSFDLLRPLIRETAAKVQDGQPSAMQTGPAARGDAGTLAAHLALLRDQPEAQALYRALTRSINPDIQLP